MVAGSTPALPTKIGQPLFEALGFVTYPMIEFEADDALAR
jgi:hypothetical protein